MTALPGSKVPSLTETGGAVDGPDESRYDTFSPAQHRAIRSGMTELEAQIVRALDYVNRLETDLADPHLDDLGRQSKEATLGAWRPFLHRLQADQARIEARKLAAE